MPDASLEHLSRDLMLGVLREWLHVNEVAGSMYERMPEDVKAEIRRQPANWMPTVASMASVKPEIREVAHALLTDTISVLESDPLSYPSATIDLTTGRGNGAEMDLAERVAELERENADLKMALRVITSVSTTACSFDGTEHDLSGVPREGGVGPDGVFRGERRDGVGGDVAEAS